MFPVCSAVADLYIDAEDRKRWDECKTQEERDKIIRLPKYSALYGDCKGLCPVYLNASENEVLTNDTRLMIEKLKEDGVECEYYFDPYLPHATLLFTGYAPEGRDNVIIAIQWMKKQLRKQNK